MFRSAVTPEQLAAIEIPKPPLWSRLLKWLIVLFVVGLLVWSWAPAEMSNGIRLFTDWRNMIEFGSAFMKPDFHDFDIYLNDMLITIQIAVWGTALAVLFGIPFAILCSSNICPWWIVHPTRRLMDVFRATNEIILALFFVVAVGLGPFAGVMALFIHNTGIVAKLFSEAVEAIDPRPVEGIRATGASRLQEVIFGVIPQVIPLWLSFVLYRFETNVRSATVLGIIGAGGIGQVLIESSRGFMYAQTAAIIMIIVASVMIIDIISSQLRKALV